MNKKQGSFSLRFGYREQQVIQLEDMSEDLSADIFNFLWAEFFDGITSSVGERSDYGIHKIQNENFRITWTKFFHRAASGFTGIGIMTDRLHFLYDDLEWYEKYDFLEFCIDNLATDSTNSWIRKTINQNVLEPNNSGYRFISSILTPVSSNIAEKSFKSAIQNDISAGHIEKALKELAKRKNRNTNQIAAEAINGVESAAKVFVTKTAPDTNPSNKSLGQLLKIIKEKNLLTANPAYSESMSKLYGYLSNSGVRHGNLPAKNSIISLAEATFILETCSAFINYLSAKLAD